MFQTIRMLTGKSQVNKLLAKHFQGLPLTTLVTAARHFPSASKLSVRFAMLLNGWSRMVGGWYGEKEAIASSIIPLSRERSPSRDIRRWRFCLER